jgi:hypothetical protein
MKLESILTKIIKTSAIAISLFVLSTYSSMAQDRTAPAATTEVGKAAIASPTINAPMDADTPTPAVTVTHQETTPPPKTTSAYETMHELLGDRIHIGLRSMTFSLNDSSRVGQGDENYYLGGIDQLEEVQDSSLSLANVTLGFYPIRNIGIEYRRDEVVAKTRNTWMRNSHSDGDFKVDGPIFLAVARLPLDQVVTLFNKASGNEASNQDTTAHNIARRFIPYLGVGLAKLSGSFEADTWWANGYDSPESWESLGRPDTIYNGRTREIRVTNEEVGTYFVYGLSVLIIDNIYADLSYSKVDVDLTSVYTFNGVYQCTRTIPMSYSSISVGIRYYF